MKIVEYLTETGGLFFLISRIQKKNRRIGMNVGVFVMETWLAALKKTLVLCFSFLSFFYSTLGLSFNADHKCCHSFFLRHLSWNRTQEKKLPPTQEQVSTSLPTIVALHFAVYIRAPSSRRSVGTLFILHLPKTLVGDHCCASLPPQTLE